LKRKMCLQDVYDVLNADEAFLTSTSLCLCPIRSLNRQPIGEVGAPAWGPVCCALRDAYIEDVGLDFVAQIMAHEEEGQAVGGVAAGAKAAAAVLADA
jgi:branched-chain amino acid aminotransferase